MTRTRRTGATLPGPVAAALVLVLAAPACEPPGSGGPGAGAPTAWSLDTVPELVVLDTIMEAPPRLMKPVGAARFSNGNVAVADPWAKVVQILDPAGAMVRTVGRAGEGPGEFSTPWWVGQCGPDSVFVWDYMLHTMSVVDSAGVVVRQYRPEGDPALFRCTRQGRFAVIGQPVERPANNLAETLATRLSAAVGVTDAAGDSVGGIGPVAFAENFILGKITQFALADDRIYVGTADSAAVDVYSLDGARLATLLLPVQPRAVTEAHVEAWLNAQAEFYHDSREQEMYKRLMRSRSEVPRHLPLYTALAVDPEGAIWVVLTSPGDGETRFLVVAPDGALLAELRLPTELSLYEVGRDYILGAVHHSTGIPGIAVYRFTRGAR